MGRFKIFDREAYHVTSAWKIFHNQVSLLWHFARTWSPSRKSRTRRRPAASFRRRAGKWRYLPVPPWIPAAPVGIGRRRVSVTFAASAIAGPARFRQSCQSAILPGPYKIPAVHTEYVAVYTNTPIVSPYRGAGQPHGNFVMESAMNHVARARGLDAAEIRRRNLVRPEDCPWDSGRIFQGNTPMIHRDSDYPAQLARALEALDYAGFKRGQPAERAQGIYRGAGLGLFVEGTGISPYEGVEVRVEPTGHVHVTTGYPSQGQGHHTTLAQVVAETLSVPPERIVVESGRSDRFAWGVGTFASRAAVVGGNAALGAAQAVRAQALELASDELEAAPEDLVLADGAVHVKGAPQMAVTLAALARAADPINTLAPGTAPGLRAADYYRSPDGAFASGVHGVVVVVDSATGMVEIDKYVVVHDCGVMINPTIVDGQILGGTAQGIGGAFYEKLRFDEAGQPLVTTFMDYLIPTAMEIPPIEIHHMESRSSLNPLGVKGVGEGGVIPAAAAFAGAVEDALEPFGATIRAHPLDPPTVLAMIEGHGGGSGAS